MTITEITFTMIVAIVVLTILLIPTVFILIVADMFARQLCLTGLTYYSFIAVFYLITNSILLTATSSIGDTV